MCSTLSCSMLVYANLHYVRITTARSCEVNLQGCSDLEKSPNLQSLSAPLKYRFFFFFFQSLKTVKLSVHTPPFYKLISILTVNQLQKIDFLFGLVWFAKVVLGCREEMLFSWQ